MGTEHQHHHHDHKKNPEDLPPALDCGSWTLKIQNNRDEPFHTVSFADLDGLPLASLRCTFPCGGVHQDEVEWQGVYLLSVLEKAGITTAMKGVVMQGRDRHWARVPSDELLKGNMLLAVQRNGSELSHAEGGPVRLVFPYEKGWKSVKWPELIAFVENGSYGHSHGK
jgi:DMSO/TMAO reductase YedYZ molybdopterin-dependent catalytic subunit